MNTEKNLELWIKHLEKVKNIPEYNAYLEAQKCDFKEFYKRKGIILDDDSPLVLMYLSFVSGLEISTNLWEEGTCGNNNFN